MKTARVEFAKHGFRNVRMDELSQKIGISKRTLYENYPSKESLFEAVIEFEMSLIKERVDGIVERIEADPEVNLIEEIHLLWQIDADSSMGFKREFFSDIQKFTPNLWEKIANFRHKEMEANFKKIFIVGQAQDVFRKDINVDLLFLIHLTAVQNILNPDVLLTLNHSPQEVMDTIYTLMFAGILTDKVRNEYINNCKHFCKTNISKD